MLLLWSALNFSKVITTTWGGKLADHCGRETLMLIGWTVFALSFLMLNHVTEGAELWPVVIFYSLFTGMSEGTERALISDYTQANARGTVFGWYHLVIGIAVIPAGLLFGSIWHFQSGSGIIFVRKRVISHSSAVIPIVAIAS